MTRVLLDAGEYDGAVRAAAGDHAGVVQLLDAVELVVDEDQLLRRQRLGQALHQRRIGVQEVAHLGGGGVDATLDGGDVAGAHRGAGAAARGQRGVIGGGGRGLGGRQHLLDGVLDLVGLGAPGLALLVGRPRGRGGRGGIGGRGGATSTLVAQQAQQGLAAGAPGLAARA